MDSLNKEESQLIIDRLVNRKGQDVITDDIKEITIDSQLEERLVEYERDPEHIDTTEQTVPNRD